MPKTNIAKIAKPAAAAEAEKLAKPRRKASPPAKPETLAGPASPIEVQPVADAARTTKQQTILNLLTRPGGATIGELAAATGWQKHSVRGFISGTVKKQMELTVNSTSSATGRTYSIEAEANANS